MIRQSSFTHISCWPGLLLLGPELERVIVHSCLLMPYNFTLCQYDTDFDKAAKCYKSYQNVLLVLLLSELLRVLVLNHSRVDPHEMECFDQTYKTRICALSTDFIKTGLWAE